MGRLFGNTDCCDEDSWGERTECDVDNMMERQDRDRLGGFLPNSSDDVCEDLPEYMKADNEWRKTALAAKGLQSFNGTGEDTEDGVSYTEGMYSSQTAGKNYGRKW